MEHLMLKRIIERSSFILSAVLFVAANAVSGQTRLSTAEFSSIEVHNGGHVTISYSAQQSVTLIKGSLDCSKIAVTDGRLVIDKYTRQCARPYELEIEIQTPSLTEMLVTDGGRVTTTGIFPQQSQIKTAIRNGGTIDLRAIPANSIVASVEEGGGIFVVPTVELTATIRSGGQIAYWGRPHVDSSVTHGGSVTRGSSSMDVREK